MKTLKTDDACDSLLNEKGYKTTSTMIKVSI